MNTTRSCQFAAVFIMAATCLSGCSRRSEEAYVDAAMNRIRDGDYARAVVHLEKAVTVYPDSGSVQCNLGLAYWKLDRADEAVGPLERAAELNPGDPRPLEFLGRIYAEQERWGEAIDAYRRADEREPGVPRILTARAEAEYRAGKLEPAYRSLMTVIDLDAGYAPALYSLAVFHRDRPLSEEAIRLGIDTRQQAAKYFRKYIAAGGEGKRLEIARRFLAALELKPAPPSAPPEPPSAAVPEPPEPPPPAAPPAAATVQVKPAKTPPSAPPEPPATEDDPVLVAARTAMDGARYDEALVLLNSAVHADPSDPNVLWELATLYDKRLKLADRATEVYQLFLKRFPRDPRATQAAQAVSKKPVKPPRPTAAPSLDPEKALALWGEGLEHHEKGEFAAAMTLYHQALKHDPHCVNALFNLGLLHKEQNRNADAAALFKKTLEIQPSMTKARYMLGVLNWQDKNYPQAATQLKQTLAEDPDYQKAHYLLGRVYEEQRRHDLARAHYIRCVALASDADVTAKARNRLARLPPSGAQ